MKPYLHLVAVDGKIVAPINALANAGPWWKQHPQDAATFNALLASWEPNALKEGKHGLSTRQ
jgi:hypothetical protein